MASGLSVFGKTNNFFCQYLASKLDEFQFFIPASRVNYFYMIHTSSVCTVDLLQKPIILLKICLPEKYVRQAMAGYCIMCETYLTIRLIKEEHAVACQVI